MNAINKYKQKQRFTKLEVESDFGRKMVAMKMAKNLIPINEQL